MPPSHGLLLRLFISSFSINQGLYYLSYYSDNVGITYYITRRLRELETGELRDVWGFICHLLITRPSKSRALECFVVDIAQKSTHIAILTLWFMQAALKDLSDRRDSYSFLICQRLLHKCHEIIFRDLPATPISAPYSAITLSLPFHSRFARRKVKSHLDPTVVGIGMVLTSFAMPRLTEIMGEVAIEQGRVDDEPSDLRSIDTGEDDIASPSITTSNISEADSGDEQDGLEPETPAPDLVLPKSNISSTPIPVSLRSTTPAAQTAPALPLHLRHLRRSRLSEDPLGQLDEPIQSPYQSSPSISSSSRPPPRSASLSLADVILRTYDQPSQVYLLRSHYCRSQVQFILALERIANSLVSIPKGPARVSALRAELTALNHKLPAEVCMPMWCSSSDTPRPVINGIPQPHHRIVRIPPGESIVLNSAERAPFLLLIEILNDDLDFDPTKRTNKEILKKIVARDDTSSGSKELYPFDSPSSHRFKIPHRQEADGGTDDTPQPSTSVGVIPPTPTSVTFLQEDGEEMDLVEQLYGDDLSRSVDISDSIVLPRAPKNKDLDAVAWSTSMPPSPLPENGHAFPTASGHPPAHQPTLSVERNPISLDDYSARMRTAAIMLAQLNANLTREVPSQNTNDGSKSWILGSRLWLSTSSTSKDASPAPLRLDPSEAGGIRDRIMQEMMALEEERVERMRAAESLHFGDIGSMHMGAANTAEDEGIIRRELNKEDPSAVVFSESWAAKKSRIRHSSPYGHLATWDCVSVIVKTGADLRQEQLAVHLIREFQKIWEEERCACWVKPFHILITGSGSGLVETISDAVSIHSIKKSEYARRLASGKLGHVSLLDHFKATYGDPSSAKFARAQRNFAKSLAGYSIVTYLLQVKDRHNGNILLDRDGHLIHIDFGFMLGQSPGGVGFEASPFKLPTEYVEVLGPSFAEFKTLFKDGLEAARKHCDRIVTLVELMQKDSAMPCFSISGEQTAVLLRDRFQPALTRSLVSELADRLIESSLGSHWTRLYDSYQYYSQSIL